MNKGELVQRLFKKKWIIIVFGIVFAILMYLYTKTVPAKYTSKATVFPLNNSGSGASSGASALNGLLSGGGGASFSGGESLNILELAVSRSVRENIAAKRLPEFDNQTITELLVKEANSHVLFSSSKIKVPTDSVEAAVLGGAMLFPNIAAKINKNGVLELNFTSTNQTLVKPISEVLIASISSFYINLRIQKALRDYRFTLKKIDSLDNAVHNVDGRAVKFQDSTYFTPSGRLSYQLPQDNLTTAKQRIMTEENMSINNRENALWVLQKATPIVQVLDQPNPPFDVDKLSGTIFGLIGFVVGLIIGVIVVIWSSVIAFAKEELKKAIQS